MTEIRTLPQDEIDRLYSRDYETAHAWNDEFDHLIKIGAFSLIACLPCGINEETARIRFGGK